MRKWIVSFMLAGAVAICLGGCKEESAPPPIPEPEKDVGAIKDKAEQNIKDVTEKVKPDAPK